VISATYDLAAVLAAVHPYLISLQSIEQAYAYTHETSQPPAKQEHWHAGSIRRDNSPRTLEQVGKEHCPSATNLVGKVDIEEEGTDLANGIKTLIIS
jgi:hypothetical protein